MFEHPASVVQLAVLWGYLMGSVPYGLLLTRAAGLGDVRSIGSGNIGATNVLRTGHKGLAAATLIADMLKGTIAVLVAGLWGQDLALVAAIGAFVGHIAPVWLRFKGGKGVATYIGVLLGLYWPGVAVFAVAWLTTAVVSRYSSLSALVACAVTPLGVWFGPGFAFSAAKRYAAEGSVSVAVVMGVLSLFVFAKHHQNIARLLAGTESKIGGRGPGTTSDPGI